MTVKSLATGVAVLAAVGAAAAGTTPVAAGPTTAGTSVVAAVTPAVYGVPLPLNPAADVPSADQVNAVLYGLADPAVPFLDKSGLVEGGIGPVEAKIADKRIQKAARDGELPLSFSVANIAPAGPGEATADITASGPQLAPQTMTVTLVNQGAWKLSRTSAMTVLQATSAD